MRSNGKDTGPTDPVELEHKKRHRQTLTLSTVGSILGMCVIVLPAIGWFGKGTIVQIMSDAMADKIEQKVEQHVAPVNAGFAVMLQNSIAELEDEISKLEYKRDRSEDFSELDQQELTAKRRRLKSNREALLAMRTAERDVDH